MLSIFLHAYWLFIYLFFWELSGRSYACSLIGSFVFLLNCSLYILEASLLSDPCVLSVQSCHFLIGVLEEQRFFTSMKSIFFFFFFVMVQAFSAISKTLHLSQHCKDFLFCFPLEVLGV